MDQMEYKRKEKIVAEAWIPLLANKEWAKVIKFGDIGFALGYSGATELCEVSEGEGREYVVEVYDVLLQSLGLEDGDFKSWHEMVTLAIESDEKSDSE
jgi:hypothetical protein